jgi:SPW repeat-containing protein
MRQRPQEYVLDIYKLVLGGFVAVAPWLFAFRYDAARLESVVSGSLVVTISVAALIAFAAWEEWVAFALGLWLIAAPWANGFPVAAAMKIHIGVGLLLVYLAGLELWLIHYNHDFGHNGPPRPRH